MADKLAQLETIAQQIVDDDVTPELAQQATQLVFGEGNPEADIVFIGEAPGKREDEQGRPFVGASGKFLDQMLESIDMKRDDVYITNIVKFRPPENRDPSPVEKQAFLPYLQRQLEVIQPKLVVTLGRHSLNCFLPDLQISKVHGELKRVKLSLDPEKVVNSSDGTLPVVILPLYHPAAALYNPVQRQTLIDDFSRIPATIKKLQ
ncbi:MAG: uracil-DNA glycosylase [Candidatus Saccharimonadales bacterium]